MLKGPKHTIDTAERGVNTYMRLGKHQYLEQCIARRLTHGLINIANKIRILGIRGPELANNIRLVQVKIDNVDNSYKKKKKKKKKKTYNHAYHNITKNTYHK